MERRLWEKYVFLVGLSATTALTRLPIGIIRDTPETRDLLQKVIEEAVAVGLARGVALPENYAQDRMQFVDTLPYDMKASMLHDLEAGKPLERSEEHTSELQSLMRISYAVFCLKKKK